MIDFLRGVHPIYQVIIATCFTWIGAAFGAAMVFFIREDINKKFLDGMLGFAAGVMISASYFSLIAPAIEMSSHMDVPEWFPPSIGFLMGAIFLRIIDRILPHLHRGLPIDSAEGIKTSWRRTTLLIMAVTLHNIPEGLAVGVAIGAGEAGLQAATLSGALALALGIGIHNFPEGMIVSMPLRREGFSRFRSFWYGQLSGMVEPFAGIIGLFAVMVSRPALPYALGFAAGAMIFVVVEELIPESQRQGNTDISTMGLIAGFIFMMMLAIGLG